MMQRTPIWVINLLAVVTYVVMALLLNDDIDLLRRGVATLLAVWSVLHTAKLGDAGVWRVDFANLAPKAVKLYHYGTTFLLIAAAIFLWLYPIDTAPAIAAQMLLVCIGLAFMQWGVTKL